MEDKPLNSNGLRDLLITGLGNIGSHLIEGAARMRNLLSVTLIDKDRYGPENWDGQAMGGRNQAGRPKAVVQAERLRALNPRLKVEALVGDLALLPMGHFRADLIVAGLDSLGARVALQQIAWRRKIPWLDGGVDAGRWLGRVNGYWPGPGHACLECALDEEDYRSGMGQRHLCRANEAVPPTRGIYELGSLVASMLILECKRYAEGEMDRALFHKQCYLDCRHHRLLLTRMRPNPQCLFDHRHWEILPLPGLSLRSTVDELLQATRQMAGMTDRMTLSMENHAFATRLDCPRCSHSRFCFRLTGRFTKTELRCPACAGSSMAWTGWDLQEELDAGLTRDWLDHTLEEAGFCHRDVVVARDQERFQPWELLLEQGDVPSQPFETAIAPEETQ